MSLWLEIIVRAENCRIKHEVHLAISINGEHTGLKLENDDDGGGKIYFHCLICQQNIALMKKYKPVSTLQNHAP